MLSLWNPLFKPVSSKADRHISSGDYLDRLFQSTLNDFFHDVSGYSKALGINSQQNEDGSLSIYIDVPGVKNQDLSVEIIDGIISIKAERKGNNSYSISKSFSIPENYDAETLTAELAEGVLILSLQGKPKIEKQAKKIEIKTLPK